MLRTISASCLLRVRIPWSRSTAIAWPSISVPLCGMLEMSLASCWASTGGKESSLAVSRDRGKAEDGRPVATSKMETITCEWEGGRQPCIVIMLRIEGYHDESDTSTAETTQQEGPSFSPPRWKRPHHMQQGQCSYDDATQSPGTSMGVEPTLSATLSTICQYVRLHSSHAAG